MRIFYIAWPSPNHFHLPDSKLWDSNLYLPLVELGHDVVKFDDDFTNFVPYLDVTNPQHQQFQKTHRPRFSEQLVQRVREAHRRKPLDIFFSYLYSACVEPDAIREISRMGIPTVNWYCNASYQFNLVEEIAPAFDFCLVPEKFRLDDYRRVGANPIYCQEAANPNVYKSVDVDREFDVTFVGQCYGTRPRFVDALHRSGVDVKALGPNWEGQTKRHSPWKCLRRRAKSLMRGKPFDAPITLPTSVCGPPVSDDQLIEMYSRSKISLGFSSVAEIPKDGSPPIKQVRLRDFEATMSGAFYLVEAFDELAEFFEPDREIVFFNDQQDLIDKAKFYLQNPIERERIRLAGYRRARAEHTWHRRFENVFQAMGLENRCAV